MDISQLVNAAESTLPSNMDVNQKTAVENTLKQICESNKDINFELLWSQYNKCKNNIHTVINKQALTNYIPEQIRITLESALKKNDSIPIIGCEGYRKLKKLAKRKF